ncbi:MAG: hypothetical protein RLY22_307, partial [Actinomycetota bacterium]
MVKSFEDLALESEVGLAATAMTALAEPSRRLV